MTIENCVCKVGFGVAMGSEMSGGVSDVYVRNCTFENTFSLASVKAIRGRGSYIKNIHYENYSHINHSNEFGVTKWFKGAIYIDGFYGENEYDPDTPIEVDETTPVIEDIYFKDITVETIAGHAVYLCGLPESHFKNIYLENVKAHGEYALKVKNIDNLQLVNTEITGDKE